MISDVCRGTHIIHGRTHDRDVLSGAVLVTSFDPKLPSRNQRGTTGSKVHPTSPSECVRRVRETLMAIRRHECDVEFGTVTERFSVVLSVRGYP